MIKKLEPCLHIEPKGGLCNRMRVLDSAIQLSRKIDKKLHMIWTVNDELSCKFESLFEIPVAVAGITTLELKNLGWDKLLKELAILKKAAEIGYLQPEIDIMKIDFDFLSWKLRESVFISTWDRFYPTNVTYDQKNPHYFTYAENFVPVAPLQDIILKHVTKFKQTIGVHVRRTDNPHQKHSPTEFFIRSMNRELENFPETTFFLATDDPDEEFRLRSEFSDKIITYQRITRNRTSLEGMQDAVVDLYCLAKTSKIIGTFYSSFTQVAAAINAIPIEVINCVPTEAVNNLKPSTFKKRPFFRFPWH